MGESAYTPRGSFDYRRDISPLQSRYFPVVPNSSPDSSYDGLSDEEHRFLTQEFMTRVLPLKKELDALEDRRLSGQFDDLRLKEQTMRLEMLQEETKRNRDLLTRLPVAMAELDAIDLGEDADPEVAALSLLDVQKKNAELYATNPAFRTVFEARQKRLDDKVAEKKAQEAADLQRASKLLSVDDSELNKIGAEAASKLGAKGAQLAADAEMIRKAETRARAKLENQEAAKTARTRYLDWLDSTEKWLMGLETEEKTTIPEGSTKTVTTHEFAPEDRTLLQDQAVNLGIPNPDPDPIRLRSQILARLNQVREQLHKPPGTGNVSSTPATMRGPAATK